MIAHMPRSNHSVNSQASTIRTLKCAVSIPYIPPAAPEGARRTCVSFQTEAHLLKHATKSLYHMLFLLKTKNKSGICGGTDICPYYRCQAWKCFFFLDPELFLFSAFYLVFILSIYQYFSYSSPSFDYKTI